MPVTREEYDNIANRDWSGGRVFVVREQNGWGIYHEPATGGSFGVGWEPAFTNAKLFGKAIAMKREAKLYVEQDLD